jgi:hypothetical protein
LSGAVGCVSHTVSFDGSVAYADVIRPPVKLPFTSWYCTAVSVGHSPSSTTSSGASTDADKSAVPSHVAP